MNHDAIDILLGISSIFHGLSAALVAKQQQPVFSSQPPVFEISLHLLSQSLSIEAKNIKYDQGKDKEHRTLPPQSIRQQNIV